MSKFKTIKKENKKEENKLSDRQLEQVLKLEESFDNKLKLKLKSRGKDGK